MMGGDKRKFLTAKLFSRDVELRLEEFDGSYIQSILALCEECGIDIESSKLLLTQPIKEKLALEAEKLNMIQRTGKINA